MVWRAMAVSMKTYSHKDIVTNKRNLLVPLMRIVVSYLQVMSFMRDFSIQWPVSVESMWTGAGTASSLPVHAGFIQCALQWSLYDRFLVAATTPITCAVILLLIPGYQLMCRAKDRLESTRNMQAAAQ